MKVLVSGTTSIRPQVFAGERIAKAIAQSIVTHDALNESLGGRIHVSVLGDGGHGPGPVQGHGRGQREDGRHVWVRGTRKDFRLWGTGTYLPALDSGIMDATDQTFLCT